MTETIYGLREEAPSSESDSSHPHIFFPHQLAQRTTQWERGADPMTNFSLSGAFDEFGQAQVQVALAIPRERQFLEVAPSGEPYLGTISRATFINRDDPTHYLIGRVSQATTHEILNDGSLALFHQADRIHPALLTDVLSGTASLRLLAHTINYYDGEAFMGLPLGQVGDFGVVVRTENLVLTEEILQEAYRSAPEEESSPEIPPYLNPTGPPEWTDEYPQEFQESIPSLAGYTFHDGTDEHTRGYWVTTAQNQFDFHLEGETPRGLPTAVRDPLGQETHIEYDRFNLLPLGITGPTGLRVEATNDYQVFQPHTLMEPNGNQTAVRFTPLGLVSKTMTIGREGEGDTEDFPGVELTYNFLAFMTDRQPVSVTSLARIWHINDANIPEDERDSTIKTVEYSDGFGRLLQTRTQAEDRFYGDPIFGNNANLPLDQSLPGGVANSQIVTSDEPRVVVSGWQIYNNKGWVVEKYEPFFSNGYAFQSPVEAGEEGDTLVGQHVTMYYDPRGQVIRTVNPNGSEERMIFGIPVELNNPDEFTPTPWEAYAYDPNDNAGRTHPETSQGYADHWNTPSSIEIDALGRTVKATVRKSSEPEGSGEVITRSRFDIQGNALEIIDPLNRSAFRYNYDLANNPLRTESIDAGITRTIIDALGNPVEQRDSKQALVLNAYDELSRAHRIWARDHNRQDMALRQVLGYGDSDPSELAREHARNRNALGQLLEQYDEAGRVQIPQYDFKGNPLGKVRQVISNEAMLAVFDNVLPNSQVEAFHVNWPSSLGLEAEQILDLTEYRTSISYDALNRGRRVVYPEDVEGERKILEPRFNHTGALEQVLMNGQVFVDHIAYNSKGQRTLVAYGNGIMTRYAYEHETFQLSRLRSDRYTKPDFNIPTYEPTGAPLQDFSYLYDLNGNILGIRERTPECGISNSLLGLHALDRLFSYDPLNRLVEANGGREQGQSPPAFPWIDQPKTQDATLTRAYAQHYTHDDNGNILELRHIASSGSFTRTFNVQTGNNRLQNLTIGEDLFPYQYDSAGNMVRENGTRNFAYNHSNQMKAFFVQAGESEPSLHAQYLYGADGNRVKKLVRRQNGEFESTTYIDDLFEHFQSETVVNNTLHIMDDQQRIATFRIGQSFLDDPTPDLKFHLGDHLGSSHVAIDQSGTLINREEYTPYGETSFGSFSRKRYRFTGKERDEESGLNYHVARYYAPWLGCWLNADPAGTVNGLNLYSYVLSSPILFSDKNGMEVDQTKANNLNSDNKNLNFEASEEQALHDFDKALNLIGERFGKRFKSVISSYYDEGRNSSIDLKSVDPKTPSFGVTKSGKTKFYFGEMYKYIETHGNIDDEQERISFIAGIILHEFAHTHQDGLEQVYKESNEGRTLAIEFFWHRTINLSSGGSIEKRMKDITSPNSIAQADAETGLSLLSSVAVMSLLYNRGYIAEHSPAHSYPKEIKSIREIKTTEASMNILYRFILNGQYNNFSPTLKNIIEETEANMLLLGSKFFNEIDEDLEYLFLYRKNSFNKRFHELLEGHYIH